MPRCLYFGCWTGDIGHYLYDPQRRKVYAPTADYPFDWTKLDGVYSPPSKSGGHSWVEGAARMFHRNGWTLIAFWDRSQDKRYGSNSVLLIEGTLFTFEESLAAHRAAFPSIWSRFTFEVVEVKLG